MITTITRLSLLLLVTFFASTRAQADDCVPCNEPPCTTPRATPCSLAANTKPFPCTVSRLPMCWLMADAGVHATGSKVFQWDDQSVVFHPGFANSFSQSVRNHQPMCKPAGIEFDGKNHWLVNSSSSHLVNGPGLAPHTMIVYIRPTAKPNSLPASCPSGIWSPCIDGQQSCSPDNNCQFNRIGNANRFNAPSTILGAQSGAESSGLGLVAAGSLAVPIYVCLNELSPIPGDLQDKKYLTLLQSSRPSFNVGTSANAHMIAVVDDFGLSVNSAGSTAVLNTIQLYVDDYCSSTTTVCAADQATPPQPHANSSRQISCIGGGAGSANEDFSIADNLFAGDIYEVIIFDNMLDASQIRCIYQYLKCKWG